MKNQKNRKSKNMKSVQVLTYGMVCVLLNACGGGSRGAGNSQPSVGSNPTDKTPAIGKKLVGKTSLGDTELWLATNAENLVAGQKPIGTLSYEIEKTNHYAAADSKPLAGKTEHQTVSFERPVYYYEKLDGHQILLTNLDASEIARISSPVILDQAVDFQFPVKGSCQTLQYIGATTQPGMIGSGRARGDKSNCDRDDRIHGLGFFEGINLKCDDLVRNNPDQYSCVEWYTDIQSQTVHNTEIITHVKVEMSPEGHTIQTSGVDAFNQKSESTFTIPEAEFSFSP